MMNARIRALLVLMRVANLPTVWSNVFAGWVLGWSLKVAGPPTDREFFALIFNFNLVFMLVGVSCLYAAGMILNDIFDVDWDRAYRPERPLVAGQVSLASARIWAAVMSLDGIVFLMLGSVPTARALVRGLGLILIGWILIYNRWHKGIAWAPIIMGLCRFMLPLIGFFSAGAASVASLPTYAMLFVHALSLWVLTVSITMLARHEARPAGAVRGWDALIFIAPLPLLLLLPWNGFIVGAAFTYWKWVAMSNRRHPLPAGVGMRVEDRLASFPFIDALLVSISYGLVSSWAAATLQGVLLGCFILVLVGRRFVPVT